MTAEITKIEIVGGNLTKYSEFGELMITENTLSVGKTTIQLKDIRRATIFEFFGGYRLNLECSDSRYSLTTSKKYLAYEDLPFAYSVDSRLPNLLKVLFTIWLLSIAVVVVRMIAGDT